MGTEESLRERAAEKRERRLRSLRFLSWLPIWGFRGGRNGSEIRGLTMWQALDLAERESDKNRPAEVFGPVSWRMPL